MWLFSLYPVWEKWTREWIQNTIIFILMKENENSMLRILLQSLTKQQRNLIFNMPSFSSNYSIGKLSTAALLLRYFDPSFNQRHFQRLVWWGLSFPPHTKFIKLRSNKEIIIPRTKPREIVSATSFGFVWVVRGSTVLLKKSLNIHFL